MAPAETGRDRTSGQVARARREAAALGLLATIPFLPYLVHLARRGEPRFGVLGDFANLELATRHALAGQQLLGPYSRFRFAHPGPLYFYVQAPLYALMHESSAALPLGACLLGTAAAATTVAAVRLGGERRHGVVALVCVLAWLGAFGNVTTTSWNPTVVVLPLLAFFALAALLAGGRAWAAVPGAFFGVLAAETHLSAVPTVAVVSVAALGAFAARRPSRGAVLPLATAALVVAVAVAPPALEQLRHGDDGNVARILRLFSNRPEPVKPVEVAVRNFFVALHWLPDRLFGATLLVEPEIPRIMGWDPVPFIASRSVIRIGAVHGITLLLGAAGAWRARDRASARLLAFGVVAELLAVVSLRGSMGDDFHYLVFWTAAASTMAWIGGFSGIASWALVRRRERVWSLTLFPLVLAASAVAWFSWTWTARNHPAPRARPDFRALHEALRERLDRTGETPVVHLSGAWNEASGLVLELAKDGRVAHVTERDRWFFGPLLPAADAAARPLHLVVSRPGEIPESIRCPALRVIATSGPLTLHGADADPETCAASRPHPP